MCKEIVPGKAALNQIGHKSGSSPWITNSYKTANISIYIAHITYLSDIETKGTAFTDLRELENGSHFITPICMTMLFRIIFQKTSRKLQSQSFLTSKSKKSGMTDLHFQILQGTSLRRSSHIGTIKVYNAST